MKTYNQKWNVFVESNALFAFVYEGIAYESSLTSQSRLRYNFIIPFDQNKKVKILQLLSNNSCQIMNIIKYK